MNIFPCDLSVALRIAVLATAIALCTSNRCLADEVLIDAMRRARAIRPDPSSSSPVPQAPTQQEVEARIQSHEIREHNRKVDEIRKDWKKFNNTYQSGAGLYEKGRYADALGVFRKAKMLMPSHPTTDVAIRMCEARIKQVAAWDLMDTGAFDAAFALLREAIALAPETREQHDNSINRLNAIKRLVGLRKEKAALDSAEKERLFYQAAYENANRLLEAKEYAVAETELRKVLTYLPHHPVVLADLGQALGGQQRFEDARNYLLQSLAIDSRQALPLRNLGSVELYLGNHEAAEAALRESLLIEADSEFAQRQLATARKQSRAGSAEWNAAMNAKVAAAEAERTTWRESVKRKLETLELSKDEPVSLAQLKPGDVILPAPDDFGSHLNTVAQKILDGGIFKGDAESPASHTFTCIGRDARGRALFLDNTLRDDGNGPRIIGETEYLQSYAANPGFVARPLRPIDGRALLKVAISESEKRQPTADEVLGKDSPYGIFGEDMVCSETAAFAITHASDIPMPKGHAGPITVLPSDFFDENGFGVWFHVAPLFKTSSQ